jgi:hypothetical protein
MLMHKILNYVVAGLILVTMLSFQEINTLKGTWQFAGGIYNGKKEGAPAGYTLQRKYDDLHFEAFATDSTNSPEKYEAGDYRLNGDTCMETETYSSQPSKLIGVHIPYIYSIHNDTLILSATLPSGMVVEEYWKKAK